MTSPLEGSPRQPIRDLVPRNVSLEPSSLKGIKNLPHLQKVAGLTFLLLAGKSRFWQQSNQQLNEKAQSELDRLKQKGITPKTKESERTSGLSTFELLVNSEWRNLYLSLDKRNTEDLPQIIADRLKDYGDPFGFGQEVTRAVLEMANDAYETQLYCDSIEIGTYNPNWNPNPTDYLEETIIRMFEEGRLSGITPFSHTKFPAGTYHREVFPKEAAQQMRDYIEKIYYK